MSAVNEPVETGKAPEAIGPYSQAIRAGEWLFCSGQIALDPSSGQMIPGGVPQQTRRALENLGAVLEAAGAGFEEVVKTTVFMADLGKFAEMNEVYAEFFSRPYPARAALGAAALPKGALVEIEAIVRLKG